MDATQRREEAQNLCSWANWVDAEVTPATYEVALAAFEAGVRWSAAMHHLRALAGTLAVCSRCKGLGLVVYQERICTCAWCDATGIARDGDLDAAPWPEMMIEELRESWAIFWEEEDGLRVS